MDSPYAYAAPVQASLGAPLLAPPLVPAAVATMPAPQAALAVEWAVCAIDFGITFDDDFFRGRDDDRQASTDDGTLGTCGEIQHSLEFRASCANTAMVQVCAEKYYPYVECLYEAAAIHASDGDLVCVELDCAAALGAATSDAVGARPAALVAFTCAALVLSWAAVPNAR